MNDVKRALDEATEELRAELDTDFVGLWEVFACLRDGHDEWTQAGLFAAAAEVLRRLAGDGAMFGGLDESELGFAAWPDQAGAIARVSAEWRTLDRDPAPGEIAWLYRPVARRGMEDHGGRAMV